MNDWYDSNLSTFATHFCMQSIQFSPFCLLEKMAAAHFWWHSVVGKCILMEIMWKIIHFLQILFAVSRLENVHRRQDIEKRAIHIVLVGRKFGSGFEKRKEGRKSSQANIHHLNTSTLIYLHIQIQCKNIATLTHINLLPLQW